MTMLTKEKRDKLRARADRFMDENPPGSDAWLFALECVQLLDELDRAQCPDNPRATERTERRNAD